MDKVVYHMPFAKVDAEKRIVSGFATLNNIDKQHDIVTTEASIKAFKSFRGNVRELHSKIAAGRLLDYGMSQYHDTVANKVYDGIFVRAYISKGAPDTWEKVIDGTLNGFSIGGEILDFEHTLDDDGNSVRVIKEYELAELSLVDNPANPLANVVSIEKANTFFEDFAHTDEKELSDMTPRGVKKSVEEPVAVEEAVEEAVVEESTEAVEESAADVEPTETVEETVAEDATPVEAPKDELADETSSKSEESAEAHSEADDAAVLADVINELKSLIADKNNEVNATFADVVAQLKELKDSVVANAEKVEQELVGVKSTVSEFDKRVQAVEADTAVRKSGDLGEVAQVSKTEKSLWGGRFLTADL